MKLVQLIYVSTYTDDKLQTDELAKIHKVAQKNNKELDVTGALVFGSGYFLQCLEGSRKVVNELYAKIVQDPRHKNILILSFNELSERQFHNWSMKFVMLTEGQQEVVRRYSVKSDFNPYEMTAKSALKILSNLAYN